MGTWLSRFFLGLGIVSLSGWAIADEVQFINGDRITGKIIKADGAKMVIDSKVAGEITVDMKDVKTFSADTAEVRLTNGTVLNGPVKSGAEGRITASGGAGVPAADVALADVKAVNPGWGKWAGNISVAGMITRGNSNTDQLTLTLNASRRTENDRLTFDGGYFYGRQRDPNTGEKITTTDNWFAAGKYDYQFTPRFYGYGLVRVERDRIAELELGLMPGIGVGYAWIDSVERNFRTEAGLSWVYQDYRNSDSEDHMAVRLAYHYDMKFNDKVTFEHNLEYLPSIEDLSDFNLNTDAGVRVTLTKAFFALFKIEWRHDATPAPGSAKNDLRYLLGVGWGF